MNAKTVTLHCPLCRTKSDTLFYREPARDYYQCPLCALIFVPRAQYLSRENEKQRYDTHENNPEDPAYRKFLSRMFAPMQERLRPGSHGLDFGSGPGPTLSVMFEEVGHQLVIYDVFYANDLRVFECQYDFITATEVFEHLHDPRTELDRLWRCLKPDGFLGIMTNPVSETEKFSQWYYKNDPTHVCFYQQKTFEWIMQQYGAPLVYEQQDAFIYQKSSLGNLRRNVRVNH